MQTGLWSGNELVLELVLFPRRQGNQEGSHGQPGKAATGKALA